MAQDLGPLIVNASERINVVMNARRYTTIRVRSQLEVGRSQIFHVHGAVEEREVASSIGCETVEAAINLVHEHGYRRLIREEEDRWVQAMEREKELEDEKWRPVLAVFCKALTREETNETDRGDATNEEKSLANGIIDAAILLNKDTTPPHPALATISLNPQRTPAGELYQVRGVGPGTYLYMGFEDALNALSTTGFHRMKDPDEAFWKDFIQKAVDRDPQAGYECGSVVCVFSK